MIEENKIENWYAIITRPRAEKKTYSRLVLSGFEAYLPLFISIRQWSDRKKKVETPLIPSYVFVKSSPKNLPAVLSVMGVVRVLKYLKKNAVIFDHEIEVLKTLVSRSEDVKVLKTINLRKGEQVKIIKGPFEGLEAECVKFQGKHRVVIRTVALGLIVEVNVPMSFVEEKRLRVVV